ncbi:peptidylprolyl isomerase [Azospirillum canadense]|uniref:peptidylprolyl isomerase n=1 Tax=Azospirillum canadense TaxID=403962 RepID=UPI002225F904|nr:peptidylprolyl isomerase [Azospirillum canadense]MCW2243024.1 peptidyl-prolyl cis-trans isomerase SurA [Azospirillum canadense]
MSSLRAVRSAFAAATACALLAAVPASSALAQAAKAPAGKVTNAPAGAPAPAERIAAVVNDEVISLSDVYARIRLALLNAGVQDTTETRQRLTPQILRQLVDERLQIQEAKRLGVTVPQAEIDDAIKRIADQNRMGRPQLDALLKNQGVPVSTLKEQVRALLAWQKVMQRRIRQEIVVGDEEVDAVMQRIKANIGKPEYLVAEIFLAVDSPDQEDEVHRTADRLVEEVRRGGNFAALARQFSQSAGAAAGGDMGWVRSGELNPEMDKVLTTMRPGQMSAPVRTATGYHVLLVRDQRAFGSSATATGGASEAAAPPPPPRPRAQPKPDLAKTKVNMKQIVLPVQGQGKEQLAAVKAEAEKLRKSIKSCADFEAKAKATGIPESGDMGTLRAKDLPPGLQQLVVAIPVGQPSPVLMSPGGAVILIVCKRDMPMIAPPPEPEPQQVAAPAPPPPPPPPVDPKDIKMPPREEIERDLINERADLLSRRYLRDLRRSAFVEFRV